MHAGRTLTRGEVWGEAELLARYIRQTIRPDRRVGLICSNDAASLISILASLLAGRSIAFLPAASLHDPELRDVAADARCGGILHYGVFHPVHAPAAPDPEGLRDPTAHLGTGSASPEVAVLYTSGTTRKPVGVRISSHNLAYNLTAMLRTAVPWTSADRVGQVLPVSHSFGLSMALLALARDAPLVMLGNGRPSRRLALDFDDQGATVFACVPYYLRLMAREGLHLGKNFGDGLRTLYLAGGGITDDDLRAAVPDYAGDTYLMYGFTEATARVAVRRMGDGAPPNSVGLPLPGTRVEIVSRDGTVLPPGTEGFVRAHSPSLMIGYLGEPARAPGTPFTTTDLGTADAYGNVFITGRDAEMMNFHGNRLSIVAVESTVMRVPGVLDARLTPDSRREDSPCTLRVIAHPEVDPDRLRKRIANAVVPRSLIREITFVATLEATRSGKPIRRH